MGNKYYDRSKISEAKFRRLPRCFALGLTVTETAAMTGLSVRSVNEIYLRIESFWSYAKGRLARFNGISKSTFYLHLKECEFRFNHRHANLYQSLLKLLRTHPL